MSEPTWDAILARVTAREPIILDGNEPQRARSACVPIANAPAPTATGLWPKTNGGRACLGIRVTQRPKDIPAIASRLAAAALERDILPVILSTIPDSGFEQFGFRVERIGGDAVTQAALEADLMRFWDMSIVVDAADVSKLG